MRGVRPAAQSPGFQLRQVAGLVTHEHNYHAGINGFAGHAHIIRTEIAVAWTNGESCSARTREFENELDSLVGQGAAHAWVKEAKALNRRGMLWQ